MKTNTFFVVGNANQHGSRFIDMIDIYSESHDHKSRAVWTMVHLDFLHDCGLRDVAEELTANPGVPIELEMRRIDRTT